MESVVDYNNELKVGLEANKKMCRCCLSTDKNIVKNISAYTLLFRDLTGIEILPSDGLPNWICTECSYLLEKSLRFKHKIVKAHRVLYEYLSRCAPFPIDSQDVELSKYATPQMCKTEILLCDNDGKSKQGFYTVLEHVKISNKTDLQIDLALQPVKIETTVTDDVKNENGFSDFDDDIPLDEYRYNVDKYEAITEEDLKKILEDRNVELLEQHTVKKRKKLKKSERIGKKKKEKLDEETKTTVRKAVEIDPTKITLIKLNMEEQIEMRKAMSADEKYLKFPFKCELCFKGFNHENKRDNHMKKHSPSRGKFECKLCNMYLPTIYSYNVHELTHTTRYECNVCSRRMVDRGSIVDHYSSQHEGQIKQFTCHICGKVSHNNKTHRGHMRNHHSGERAKCEQCGKTFVNKDSLNDHMLIHKGIKNHECEKCGKKFRTKTQLTHHYLKHSDSKNYYCVECDVRFKSEHNLRQHLHKSLKHRDKSTLKFACPRCPLRLESSKVLQHHVAYQHDGLRLHRCAHCGAALATRNSLAKHVRTAHQGYKAPLKHVCDACGKPFRSKNVLINHVRTHTGEKPYECEECGRHFSQRTAMKTHFKLVHLKLKRNTKIKDIQQLGSEPKLVVAKEEPATVYETWSRPLHQSEIYFTVSAE